MKHKQCIILDSGFQAEVSTYKKTEYLNISIYDFYRGYGNCKLDNFAKLLTELSNKGYINEGISTIQGIYDSVEDLILRVSRKI